MKFILDTHIHTVASGHAYSTVTENAEAAIQKGLELIAITDHGPKMPGSCHKLYFTNLHAIPKKIKGVTILSGAEVNIMDTTGKVDLSDKILSKLDVVIASIHSVCYECQGTEQNTNSVINTMKNQYVKIMGHLGDPRYPIDLDAVVEASSQTGTIIEINSASLLPDSVRVGSGEFIIKLLEKCKKANLPVVLGSDSHYHSRIGDFDLLLPLLAETGFPENLIINTSLKLFSKYIKSL